MKNQVDWTKPIRTRNGLPVEILTMNRGRGNRPVVGYIGDSKNIWYWYKDGSRKSGQTHPHDVINGFPDVNAEVKVNESPTHVYDTEKSEAAVRPPNHLLNVMLRVEKLLEEIRDATKGTRT